MFFIQRNIYDKILSDDLLHIVRDFARDKWDLKFVWLIFITLMRYLILGLNDHFCC